jgi:CDP-diacylglycerol pyrophosphatase
MATAFFIIILILVAGAARYYVAKKYDVNPEKHDIIEAVNRNRKARVRHAQFSAKN